MPTFRPDSRAISKQLDRDGYAGRPPIYRVRGAVSAFIEQHAQPLQP